MSDLYDADVLLWSEQQADLLRRRAAGELVNDTALDWPNIAEEIADVGQSLVSVPKSGSTTSALSLLVQQIAAGDRPEVELGRRFEEQLGGGGDAGRSVADGPDARPVGAGLQLGAEDEGGVGFVVVGVGHEDGALAGPPCAPAAPRRAAITLSEPWTSAGSRSVLSLTETANNFRSHRTAPQRQKRRNTRCKNWSWRVPRDRDGGARSRELRKRRRAQERDRAPPQDEQDQERYEQAIH